MEIGDWSAPASKFEFASPAWMAALHAALQDCASRADPATRLSLCEVFTGVPAHLDRHGTGLLAWHCRVSDGVAHFEETEADDTDSKVVADYAFLLPLTRWRLDESTAKALEAYLAEGAGDGRFVRRGDTAHFPPEFAGLHDAMVKLTA
jgi:hypothetical protein